MMFDVLHDKKNIAKKRLRLETNLVGCSSAILRCRSRQLYGAVIYRIIVFNLV